MLVCSRDSQEKNLLFPSSRTLVNYLFDAEQINVSNVFIFSSTYVRIVETALIKETNFILSYFSPLFD